MVPPELWGTRDTLESTESLETITDKGRSVETRRGTESIAESPKSVRQARRSSLIRIFAWAIGSMDGWGVRTESTHSLQVPVDDIEAVKILQPTRDVYQLWKSVMPAIADTYEVTHKFDSIHFSVVLDEIVDIAVIHPFRQQRKPGRLHVQRRAEQRYNVWVA